MLDNLEVEIKNWDNAYSFSSEKDDKKRIYTIYSPKLRNKLREMIFHCKIPSGVSSQYEGKNTYGDRILYQLGKDDLPDQLTLISRELEEQVENASGLSEKDVWANWDEEWKEVEEKWRKAEIDLGIPSGSMKHYWSGKDSKGDIVNEGMYFKSENQFVLVTSEIEKDNCPKIQEDEKQGQKSVEENKSEGEVFTPHHQILPKKQ